MHEHHLLGETWMLVNTVANLGIVLGYVLVPFTVLRYMPLTKSVLFSGGVFFMTCALTHLAMALGFIDTEAMVINHAVQAASVVWFVTGFFRLLRRAEALQQEPSDVPPIDPDGLT